MSKLLTSLTLAAALTFAAPAYAGPANAESDVYPEAIWDIHLSFGAESFATQSASLQTGGSMGALRAAPATTYRERKDTE